MYEELTNLLRRCGKQKCKNCEHEHILGCVTEMNEKAADAIEELTRENESLAKSVNEASEILRRRWIPMTERLPDIGTYIVAGKMKYSFEENYENFVDVASYGFWDDKKEESWLTFNDWYEGQQEYEITHWMPLPEPPKGGK